MYISIRIYTHIYACVRSGGGLLPYGDQDWRLRCDTGTRPSSGSDEDSLSDEIGTPDPDLLILRLFCLYVWLIVFMLYMLYDWLV